MDRLNEPKRFPRAKKSNAIYLEMKMDAHRQTLRNYKVAIR